MWFEEVVKKPSRIFLSECILLQRGSDELLSQSGAVSNGASMSPQPHHAADNNNDAKKVSVVSDRWKQRVGSSIEKREFPERTESLGSLLKARLVATISPTISPMADLEIFRWKTSAGSRIRARFSILSDNDSLDFGKGRLARRHDETKYKERR